MHLSVLRTGDTHRVLARLVDGVGGVRVALLSPVLGRVVGVCVGRGLPGVREGWQRRQGWRGRGLVTPLSQPQVLQLPQHVVEAGVEVVRQPDRQGGQVGP